MNTSATNIKSYDDYTAHSSELNKSIVSTVVSSKTLKRKQGYTTQAVCLIGVATVGSMLVTSFDTPSQINLYPAVYEHASQSSLSAPYPQGYEIINRNEIINYLIKHPYLKNFLQSNLNKLQSISGATNLSLEYEGIKEEGWESLYVIIHLANDDEEHVNKVEDALFDEWLNDVPEKITNNFTVSFA